MKNIMIPIVLSSFFLLNTSISLGAGKDSSFLNALSDEAKETSMEKEAVVDNDAPEPSVTPKAKLNYDRLEKNVASQIKGLLSSHDGSTQDDREIKKTRSNLENELEKIVSSALLKGSKLNDIRHAVSAAMTDIKKENKTDGNLSNTVVESASKVLQQIVGEEQSVTEISKVIAAASGVSAIERADDKDKTVTVLKGETLYQIAKRVYGTGANYLSLYKANRDTITDPNVIHAGQVFKLP